MTNRFALLVIGIILGALIAYLMIDRGRNGEVEPPQPTTPQEGELLEDLLPPEGGPGGYGLPVLVVSLACDAETGELEAFPDPASLRVRPAKPFKVLWYVPDKQENQQWAIQWKAPPGENDQFPPPGPKVIPCRSPANAWHTNPPSNPQPGELWTYAVRVYDCDAEEQLICELDPEIKWRE